ncbi:late expression factor 10 [Spodoptera litura nucleopolyhedrovirus]|uniref:Late expression factor 10 n=1 Tax=Spodoptera litura multicapsid nucleopolyhedrovirus TaxID=46242 RepID=Q91BH7_NPVST|nr:LEF-10 [Spodoptera litura nucleopolyhedrovirus]AAL01733.1 late expression factor 10 [Spodoptera litura nucleopolyhedrovirus]QHN73898.1 lef-10 [Spodoptera litura nucleopolyhedrovirus]
MSTPSTSEDVLSAILENNLELVNNTYIILHVFDEEPGNVGGDDDHNKIQPMCIGEIGFVQTDHIQEESVSYSSASSELSSDQNI